MLSLEQCMDIKLLHKEGHSIRQIARLTGNSRNTVRRMLRGQQPPRFKTLERGSKLDAFRDYVRQRYEACGSWRKSARWASPAPSIFYGATSPH